MKLSGRIQLRRTAVLVSLFLVAILSVTWVRLQIVTLGFSITEKSKEERQLQEENNKLRLQIAALKSPARLQKLASERFGLATPKNNQLIIIANSNEKKEPLQH